VAVEITRDGGNRITGVTVVEEQVISEQRMD